MPWWRLRSESRPTSITEQPGGSMEATRVRTTKTVETRGGDVREVEEMGWDFGIGRDEIKRKEAEINHLREQLLKMERGNVDLQKHVSRAERQCELLTENLASQSRATEHAREQYKQMGELLGMRTKELTGAQAFLTKEDALSGEEVKAMVEALNNEMLQTAAYIADSFGIERVNEGREMGSEELRRACAKANDILGEEVVSLLKSTPHEDDPLLLEIAVQSCVASFCRQFIRAWYTNDQQRERLLAQIYEGIRDTEEQAVSGRWRALTRSQMHRMGHTNTEENLVTNIVDWLVGVLVCAGWTGSFQQIRKAITTKFSARLAVVARLALRLQKVIGQDITSSDFEVVFIEHGVKFDPAVMDDAYAENPKKSGKKKGGTIANSEGILCTNELGLRRLVREQKENKVREVVVMKPKVVLFSELRAATSRA